MKPGPYLTSISSSCLFSTCCLRQISGIALLNHPVILKRCESFSVDSQLKGKRLRWFGHICRMSDSSLPKVGQNCRGRPRIVWSNVILSDIHKLKLHRYTCDALNKPVWRELTCIAPDACWLSIRVYYYYCCYSYYCYYSYYYYYCYSYYYLAISSRLDHWLRCCLSFCGSLAFVITCLLSCLGSTIPCSDTARSADDHETFNYFVNSEVHSVSAIGSRSCLPMQCRSCWKLHWYRVMCKAQHWTLLRHVQLQAERTWDEVRTDSLGYGMT